jgi:uncharacterized membrane protein YjfL (UPF0719 family)
VLTGANTGVKHAIHFGALGKMDFVNYVVSIVISLVVGLGGFVLAYKIFDAMTPGVEFADQLRHDNRAVAIFLAGLFIGLGLLLGNAVK